MSFEEFLLGRARVSSKRHQRITLDDKMMFFQQLGSLVSSGTPLLTALRLSAQQSQSYKMETVLTDIANRVAAGVPLNAAMSQYPKIFEPHWVAMISTGEASGQMNQVLHDLNEQVRESQATRRKVLGAMTYPVVLMMVSIAVLLTMLWFVVPTFAGMFEEMNAELPGITQWVLSASDAVASYGWIGLLAAGAAAFGLKKMMNTDSGLRNIRALMMSVPVLGELTVQSAMYRFSSNLALLLKSGVPILDSLRVMANVYSREPAYRDAMEHSMRRLAAGCTLADTLEESGVFTTMMVSAVRIGEQSAMLDKVLDEITPYYREKTNSFVAKATRLMEPCIIVGMGGAIAVVMLAIYIPMFEMAGKVN